MKKLIALYVGVFCVTLIAEKVPEVTNVRFAQNASRVVEIRYDLTSDAIVTVDVMTNGVSIGGACQQGMSGAVGTIVRGGQDRLVSWRPALFWPEGGNITQPIVTVSVKAYPTNSPPDYMVASLDNSGTVRWYEREDFLPGGIGDAAYRTSKMVFRRIPAAGATYAMGAPASEDGYIDNQMLHLVSFTNDFYLAVFPLTQGQYKQLWDKAVTTFKNNHDEYPASYNSGEDAPLCPVDRINGAYLHGKYGGFTGINDFAVEAYTLIYTVRENTRIRNMLIPTQSEWEFACRAGSRGPLYEGTNVAELAWYAGNSEGRLRPVGLKKPNAFGLYDMLGNVSEITRDTASRCRTSGVSPINTAASHGNYHACCGGSYLSEKSAVRCTATTPGSNWQTHLWDYRENGLGARFYIPLP